MFGHIASPALVPRMPSPIIRPIGFCLLGIEVALLRKLGSIVGRKRDGRGIKEGRVAV